MAVEESPLQFLDLVLLSGSVYGLSWLLTKSKVSKYVYAWTTARDVPVLPGLLSCIVCMSVWVSLALIFFTRGVLLPVRLNLPHDPIILVGWTTFTTWAMAKFLKDAD